MKIIVLLLSILTVNQYAQAVIKEVGYFYFVPMVGHVHKNPSRESSSLTTIQCGHRVRVIEDDSVTVPTGWTYLQVGEDRGFIQMGNLEEKAPSCFQAKYPKFYISLGLDLTDLYYFGRIEDQYSVGKSRVK